MKRLLWFAAVVALSVSGTGSALADPPRPAPVPLPEPACEQVPELCDGGPISE